LRPSSAFAAAGDDEDAKLDPQETYQVLLNTIRSDFYNPAAEGAPKPGKAPARPDITKLTYAAINGMLAAIGDRYTEFWDPKEYRENMQETSGVFAGVGARLDVTRDKKILITEPIEGSPAAKKGLLAGDVILAVEGRPVTGMDIDSVIERIKGDPGTSVRLTIERKGTPKPFVVSLTRAEVQSPIVEWRMEDPVSKIGYISLAMFNEQADQQFAAALAKLERQGMKALIFDLRDNPGGLLNIAQDIASRFVPNGPVVWVKEKNGRMSSMNVERGKHQGRLSTGAYPVVVLVNGNSASASEIVSGAIRDHGAGTLVGTTTFGKGLVQTIIPLGDDSAVKITTQHYFTPNKTDINKKYDATGKQVSGGIKPDVEVALTDKDIEAMRLARRDAPQDKTAPDRYDPQLQKGLEVLRTQLATRDAGVQRTARRD
jgi:carboxyl-terminal processing protease